MNKLLFTFIFCAVWLVSAAETDIAMPSQDVAGINNGYSLVALCISSVLPFALILVKLIFDNKKNTELADYIKKHNEEHKEWREQFRAAVKANEKRLDKTDEILQRLVDNDIEQDRRLNKLEARQ